MVVWSGKGFLSLLILVVLLFMCVTILPQNESEYGFTISLFGASWFSWVFGNKWNSKLERIFIDKETGKEIVYKGNHSLFWIKMEYWGIIFMTLSLIILAQNLTKDGIYISINILFGILSIASLVIFINNIIKKSTQLNTQIEKTEKIIPKTNYSQLFEEKERTAQSILDKKDDDVSRFMPK